VLEESEQGYDVIILDLADPVEEGPCYLLYTVKFYQMVKKKLNPGGVFVTQSGPASLVTMSIVFTPIHKTLTQVWGDNVYGSVVHIPSFADCYGFNVACDVNVRDMSAELINQRIAERIEGGASALKFYDGQAHKGLYSMPKYLRTAVENEQRIITKHSPLFVNNGYHEK